MCALVLLVGPALGASVSDGASYADMNDAELTEALQSWGTLQSSDRRELLVELKKRMERSKGLPAQASARQTQARAPRITIYIHVRKNMRFGAGIENQVSNRRSSGVVVMRGGTSGVDDVRLAAREILAHMRGLIANSEPLPGPGFGDGFERRQAYLRASFGNPDNQAPGTLTHFRAPISAGQAGGQEETHLRDD